MLQDSHRVHNLLYFICFVSFIRNVRDSNSRYLPTSFFLPQLPDQLYISYIICFIGFPFLYQDSFLLCHPTHVIKLSMVQKTLLKHLPWQRGSHLLQWHSLWVCDLETTSMVACSSQTGPNGVAYNECCPHHTLQFLLFESFTQSWLGNQGKVFFLKPRSEAPHQFFICRASFL